ncbi:condensation domain-containing protein, partial [Paenibacillus odorifer]
MSEQADGGLMAGFEYSTELFEAETIQRMSRHWLTWLEEISERPSEALGKLELMEASEKRQIVEEWNQTEVVYADQRLVTELIEEQAAENPEGIAVIF